MDIPTTQNAATAVQAMSAIETAPPPATSGVGAEPMRSTAVTFVPMTTESRVSPATRTIAATRRFVTAATSSGGPTLKKVSNE